MSQFTQHTPASASPEGKLILDTVQKNYGFIPNLFAYMIEAPVTVEAYLNLNVLIDKSSLSAARAQVALLAVSVENKCNFCEVAHRAMGKKAGVPQQTIDAILTGGNIEDKKDQAITDLAQEFVRKRGWVADDALENFYAEGFTKQQVFEVILIVSIKTLSNFSNHLTQPEPNKELLAML